MFIIFFYNPSTQDVDKERLNWAILTRQITNLVLSWYPWELPIHVVGDVWEDRERKNRKREKLTDGP